MTFSNQRSIGNKKGKVEDASHHNIYHKDKSIAKNENIYRGHNWLVYFKFQVCIVNDYVQTTRMCHLQILLYGFKYFVVPYGI